jgi:ABC-type arginine/histidine transport system permease subunit
VSGVTPDTFFVPVACGGNQRFVALLTFFMIFFRGSVKFSALFLVYIGEGQKDAKRKKVAQINKKYYLCTHGVSGVLDLWC